MYGISYTLKFMSKLRKTNPIDYTVMALEGLWWVESGEFSFDKKDNWCWTLMMMQPKHITAKMYQAALQQLKEKKDPPALARLRFESFQEGLCVQIMHVGPYSEEPQVARTDASLCRRERLCLSRQAPRNLYGRSAPRQAGQAQDDLEASGGKSQSKQQIGAGGQEQNIFIHAVAQHSVQPGKEPPSQERNERERPGTRKYHAQHG